MLDKKRGEVLLKLAKNSIKLAFDDKGFDLIKTNDKELNAKVGVFVTLYTKLHGKGKELRGCIGFTQSKIPLWRSVAEAARLSAFEDPRFPALRRDELDHIAIEISVLTKPQQVKNKKVKHPLDIVKQIEVGKDGLMIEYSGFTGLLLPQVAVEYGWDAQRFLEETCVKAGLSPRDWKNDGARIYKFQCVIFSGK